MDKKTKGADIVKAYNKLKTTREPLNKTWADCYKFSYPMRGKGLSDESFGIDSFTNAKTDKSNLLDSTATDAIRLLSSSILSAITPSNVRWFGLQLPAPEASEAEATANQHDIQVWLDKAAGRCHLAVHGSNYDSQALEFFIDIAIAGTSPMFIEIRDRKLHFETWNLQSVYGADTARNGMIDTVYKHCMVTPAEAVKKGFKLPEAVKQEFEEDPYSQKTFEFIYCIRPRYEDMKKAGWLKSNMPYESTYVFVPTGEIVYESGFQEFPVIMPRWMRVPDTDFATGPMLDALPDMKTLNAVVDNMLKNTEMKVMGMYAYVDDGILNPSKVQFGPGKWLPVGDMNNIPRPIAQGGDINFAINEIVRLQTQIQKTLLANQLSPTEKVNMTAAEVYQRSNMLRQVLGPVFARLQSEFLQPLITRVFGLLLRDGQLGDIPEGLGEGVNIEYTSPLARAQRSSEIQAIIEFEGMVQPWIEFSPEILDNYDKDKATQMKARYLSVPAELIVDPKDVERIRKERAEQQQAAQQQAAQQQAMMQGAQSAQGGKPPQ